METTIDVPIQDDDQWIRVSVSAEIYGPLAVHNTILSSRTFTDGWTVTHVASGCAVCTAREKTSAVRAAESLMTLPGLADAEIPATWQLYDAVVEALGPLLDSGAVRLKSEGEERAYDIAQELFWQNRLDLLDEHLTALGDRSQHLQRRVRARIDSLMRAHERMVEDVTGRE